MRLNSELIIDCDKMKARNTGLHYYCLHLVNALSRKAKEEDEAVTVFAPKRVDTYFANDVVKMHKQPWNKYWLYIPSRYKVWHQTFQLGKYFPASRQKVVLTIHDLNFLYENDSKRDQKMKRIQQNMDRADSITAISEFTKHDVLTHLNTRGKTVEVIYNGGEQYQGNLVRPESRQTERPFLFSLGTVLEKKNFHVLPCLLKGNDFDLIIAGNPSAYSLRVLKEAKRWGVEDRVFLVGAVSEEEKQWYLKHCTAFLFPSIAEGFGLPVVEAMYYGKPIFLSDHTSLPEIGGEVATYFNDRFDPEGMQSEFARGLSLYGNEITADMIRANALKFSWDNTASQYWNLYKSLL